MSDDRCQVDPGIWQAQRPEMLCVGYWHEVDHENRLAVLREILDTLTPRERREMRKVLEPEQWTDERWTYDDDDE
jgi:hypothetical protein